jgi:hypothetical protein
MSDTKTTPQLPARAIASILFACCSLFVFRSYAQLHWVPAHFSKEGDYIFRRVLSETGPIRDQLDLTYRILAVISLGWCIWAWRTESRVAALFASAFTALAMATLFIMV